MHIDDVLEDSRDVAGPSIEAMERGRARSLAVEQASVERIIRFAARRTRRKRVARVLVVAAVATAVAVTIPRLNDAPTPVAAPTVPSRGTPPATTEAPKFVDAAQILQSAGAAAGAQHVDVASAKYWRVDSEYQQGTDPLHRRTFWQGHTSGGFLSDDGVDPDQILPMSRSAFSFPHESLTWDQLVNLPTSKAALLKQLRAGTSASDAGQPDYYAFKSLGELLAESPAPPAVRQGLWEAAAELKGVSTKGKVTDASGRSGYAISLGNQTYIVDPQTGVILESRLKLEGGLTYRITYLSQGPTDTAPTDGTAVE